MRPIRYQTLRVPYPKHYWSRTAPSLQKPELMCGAKHPKFLTLHPFVDDRNPALHRSHGTLHPLDLPLKPSLRTLHVSKAEFHLCLELYEPLSHSLAKRRNAGRERLLRLPDALNRPVRTCQLPAPTFIACARTVGANDERQVFGRGRREVSKGGGVWECASSCPSVTSQSLRG